MDYGIGYGTHGPWTINKQDVHGCGCVWKCCVPLNPMVLLIIIPMKNGYFIGNIPNIFRQTHVPIQNGDICHFAKRNLQNRSRVPWTCDSAMVLGIPYESHQHHRRRDRRWWGTNSSGCRLLRPWWWITAPPMVTGKRNWPEIWCK